MSLTTPDKKKVAEARATGMPEKDVANLFKCSVRTVRRIFAQQKAGKDLHRGLKSGRPPITTPREDRAVVNFVKIDPKRNATDGSDKMKEDFNKVVSPETIRRRLNCTGLYARRAVLKPLMTPKHRKQRLEFARTYRNWTTDDWAKVLFTDETKVNLFHADGNHLIRRPVGKRYALKYIRPTVKFKGGNIMCWGNETFKLKDFIFYF